MEIVDTAKILKALNKEFSYEDRISNMRYFLLGDIEVLRVEKNNDPLPDTYFIDVVDECFSAFGRYIPRAIEDAKRFILEKTEHLNIKIEFIDRESSIKIKDNDSCIPFQRLYVRINNVIKNKQSMKEILSKYSFSELTEMIDDFGDTVRPDSKLREARGKIFGKEPKDVCYSEILIMIPEISKMITQSYRTRIKKMNEDFPVKKTPLFQFKTKSLSSGSIRTIVSSVIINGVDVIQMENYRIVRKNDIARIPDTMVMREGNIYQLVCRRYAIQEKSLRAIMFGLQNPKDNFFAI